MAATTPRRPGRLRPSPAMVVASAALFVALGGAGYATTTVGSEQIRNNSIDSVDVKNGSLLSRDLRDGAILPRDLHPSALDIENDSILSRDIQDETILSRDIQNETILSGDIGEGAIQERDIDPAVLTAFEGPRAFARRAGDSLVDEGNSKGIIDGNVSRPEVGVYCFDDLGFDPKIAIATFEGPSVGPGGPNVVLRARADDDVHLAAPFELCPGTEQASVRLFNRDDGAPINGSFYVLFE